VRSDDGSLEDAYAAVGGDEPVVIGQLVGKVPFWAVDHKDRAFHNEECFGQYSQIYAYPEPNTGFVFGKLVYTPFAKTRKGSLHFRPEKAIDADLGHYLNGAKTTVVIEADILKIRKFTEETGNKIVYSFARNKAYKNFCFTAILSHKRFLQTASGKAQAHDLLRALTKAIDLIYTYRNIALDHAVSKFEARGYSPEIIDGALSDLIKEDIFSRSLLVSKDGWLKSGYIRGQVEPTFSPPSFRRFVDNRIAKEEFTKYLHEKTEHGSYLFTNISSLLTVLRQRVVPFSAAVLLFIFPAIFVHVRSHLHSIMWNPWVLLHFLVNTLVVTSYCLRAHISHWAKRDPTKWLEWGLPAAIGYAVGEVTIVIELIKSLN